MRKLKSKFQKAKRIYTFDDLFETSYKYVFACIFLPICFLAVRRQVMANSGRSNIKTLHDGACYFDFFGEHDKFKYSSSISTFFKT